MNDDPFNFDDLNDPHDPNDPMRKEEEEVRKHIKNLVEKLQGLSDEPVSNDDLLQYQRIINFNFAALRKMITTFVFRLNMVEESLLSLHKKMDSFLDSNKLIEESLNEPDSTDEP